MMTLLQIWFTPRRAGKKILRRSISSALIVHFLCMFAAAALLIFSMSALRDGAIGYVLGYGPDMKPLDLGPQPASGPAAIAAYTAAQETHLGPFDFYQMLGKEIVDTWVNIAGGVLGQAGTNLGGTTSLVALGALIVVGEIFYWCFFIPVLALWMGCNLPRRRHLRYGAILTGYATCWIIPLCFCWVLASILGIVGWELLVRPIPPMSVLISGSPPSHRFLFDPEYHWLPRLATCLFSTVLPAGMFAMILRLAAGWGMWPMSSPPLRTRCVRTAAITCMRPALIIFAPNAANPRP